MAYDVEFFCECDESVQERIVRPNSARPIEVFRVLLLKCDA